MAIGIEVAVFVPRVPAPKANLGRSTNGDGEFSEFGRTKSDYAQVGGCESI